MSDGTAITVPDIYALLRESIAREPKWTQSISAVFDQQYTPSDVQHSRIIAEFAHKNDFQMCDMTPRLSKVQSMSDLVKLYSTCSKLALAQPKTLFYVLPDMDTPHSLSVLEGLFALRLSLLAGSLRIFFRDRKDATPKERGLMRTKVYDLCLWQSDNIVLLSNNTENEMRRKLSDLVVECSICFESLTDISHGSIVYPYRCEHAFHSLCVQECTECPLCRNNWKPRRTVFRLFDDTSAVSSTTLVQVETGGWSDVAK